MPKPVLEEVERQLKKLERMHPDAAETATLRNWLDWMVTLPWGKTTKDNLDLKEAQRILDEDHYGLEKVKERILEYLAVRKLKEKAKGPLLCFVGPPGVGQDQPRQVDRARAGPQVRAPLARRRARTRPRSAATAAPTSARCPAASSRASTRPARTTRSS